MPLLCPSDGTTYAPHMNPSCTIHMSLLCPQLLHSYAPSYAPPLLTYALAMNPFELLCFSYVPYVPPMPSEIQNTNYLSTQRPTEALYLTVNKN